MKRPIESDYTSHVAYARALEEYCDMLAQPAQEPVGSLNITSYKGLGNYDFDYVGQLPDGTYSVYTTPPAAQPAPVQEPVAWITQAGVLTKTDTKAQGELYGWTPLYTAPEPAQEPNNFCPRCGKRVQGVLGRPQMHTCTPPLWGHT